MRWTKKNRQMTLAVFSNARDELDLLDRFEHLKCGLVRANKKGRWISPAAFLLKSESDFLDFFQHLENGLARAHEKTLVILAQATTLKRIATGALFFSSHGDLLNVNAISESIEL